MCRLPEDNALVLASATHVVVGIVCLLEYVGRKWLLQRGRVTELCSIFVQDRVRVGRHVFVGIESDQEGGANVCINCVRHKAFTQSGDQQVVGDGLQGCEVPNGL